MKALRWIDQHSAEEIAAEMPAEYAQGNPTIYIEAIAKAKDAFSKDGVMQASGAEAVRSVLAQFDPEIAEADVEMASTYTNEYLPAEEDS